MDNTEEGVQTIEDGVLTKCKEGLVSVFLIAGKTKFKLAKKFQNGA